MGATGCCPTNRGHWRSFCRFRRSGGVHPDGSSGGCREKSSGRPSTRFGHRDFFARLLGTTSGHLGRLYGRESLGRARTEGLLDTLRTFAAAAAAFGGLERAQDWLDTALPALGGDRPIDLCDTFEGRRLVREIIRKVEYGEFP